MFSQLIFPHIILVTSSSYYFSLSKYTLLEGCLKLNCRLCRTRSLSTYLNKKIMDITKLSVKTQMRHTLVLHMSAGVWPYSVYKYTMTWCHTVDTYFISFFHRWLLYTRSYCQTNWHGCQKISRICWHLAKANFW